MKIYKAIRANELEQYTSNGWEWDGIERKEQQSTVVRDDTGRVMTDSERQAHGYRDHYNAPRMYDHKHYFGDVLIFIVWKDKEQISREQAAEARANTAEYQLNKVTDEVVQCAKTIEKLTDERDAALKTSAERQQAIYARDDKNRKLEGDIARIRTAIGTDRMNEILATKGS